MHVGALGVLHAFEASLILLIAASLILLIAAVLFFIFYFFFDKKYKKWRINLAVAIPVYPILLSNVMR